MVRRSPRRAAGLTRLASATTLAVLAASSGAQAGASPLRLSGSVAALYATSPAGGRTIEALRAGAAWTETGVTWRRPGLVRPSLRRHRTGGGPKNDQGHLRRPHAARRASPEQFAAMYGLEAWIRLGQPLRELLKLRASKLNRCAFCIDMHWKDARAAGEGEERRYSLDAWRESPLYSERERAALPKGRCSPKAGLRARPLARARPRWYNGCMHSPLRTEADVFRLVVAIGVAAASVIALTLLFDPAVGAVWGAALIGFGIGIAFRSARGTLPRKVARADGGDARYRLLVVANETVAGRALLEQIRNRCRGRESEVLVITPALVGSRAAQWASDLDEGIELARERMERSLAAIASAGLDARGEIGDSDPNLAIEDALRTFPADEILISTHPPRKSRWLESGVVQRAREELDLPITHVVVDLEAEPPAARGRAVGGSQR